MNKSNKLSAQVLRKATLSSMITLGLLVLCILLNVAVGWLPSYVANPNVTSSKTFQLSGTTKDWLKTLDEDVRIYFVCNGGKKEADKQLYSFFEQYGEMSDRVTVTVVDSSADASFINAYGGEWPSDMSVIVESARRFCIVKNEELYYYYNSIMEENLTPDEYFAMLDYCDSYDSTGSYSSQFIAATTPYFDGDSRVTNAINFVIRERVAVAYALTGSGAGALDSRLMNTLSQIGYDLRTTLTVSTLPDDCDVLVINNPATDLDATEAAALSAYLANGGDLLLATSYTVGRLENLDGVLSAYGMSFEAEINTVYENHTSYAFSDSSQSYPYLFYSHIAQHAATGAFDGNFVTYTPHNIVLDTACEGVTLTSWLYTSEAGCVHRYDEASQTLVADEEKAVCNVGVIAEKGESAVIWIADPIALSNTCNAYSEGGNFQLIASTLNWVTGAEGEAIVISPAVMNGSNLSLTVGSFIVWGLILIFFIPIGVIVAGIIVWYLRKKR